MALHTEKSPRAKVLAEDNFRDGGTSGWVQLVGSQYPTGVVMFDDEYGYTDGGGSLVLETGDAAQGGVGDTRAAASAVKRMWRGSQQLLDGYVDMQWVWYFGSQYASTNPRVIEFGLDCASPTGTPRLFFRIRWLNFDSTTATRVTKYQIHTGSGWVDLPAASWQAGAGVGDAAGTVYPHGWNENKRDWHLMRARFDVKNQQYVGFQIDGDPHGSFTGVPADEAAIRAFSPPTEALPTFENGFNGWFSIENRSDNRINNHAWAGLGYFRAETGWNL
jgi:hypothetical protein